MYVHMSVCMLGGKHVYTRWARCMCKVCVIVCAQMAVEGGEDCPTRNGEKGRGLTYREGGGCVLQGRDRKGRLSYKEGGVWRCMST